MAVAHEELWVRWHQSHDMQARERLVETYLWLVRYVAGRLMVGLPPHFDQGDIEGHGCFGLLEAVERFDYHRGVRFETFAIPWVRGACVEGIKALQWAPNLRKRVRQLEKAQADLQVTLGRDPTDQELAGALNVSTEALDQRMLEAGCLTVLSLEELAADDEGEGSALKDRLADPTAVDPLEFAGQVERRERLAQAIETLPDQEKLVISLFYYEGLIAREISELLRLSPARISQIHSRAILRLRGKLARIKASLVS